MRHTDQVRFTVEGLSARPQIFMLPAADARHIRSYLTRKTEKTIPAEIVIPDLFDPIMGPARTLRGARYRENLTQKQLAEILDIKQHHLSEMENGKRPIGKEMAKRLGKALRAHYQVFL